MNNKYLSDIIREYNFGIKLLAYMRNSNNYILFYCYQRLKFNYNRLYDVE